MIILIVDYHSDEQRLKDLEALIKEVDPRTTVERVCQLAGGDGAFAPPLCDMVVPIKENVAGRNLILMHCGENQHYVPAAMSVFGDVPCLLYHGGTLNQAVGDYLRNSDSSLNHAAIAETFALAGLTEEQKARLKKCVQLILGEARIPARRAVEEAFGAPELDKNLNDLYDAMRNGESLVTLIEMRRKLLDKEPWE